MNRTFRQNPRLEAAPLNEEVILFDPTTLRFFLLNRTSTFVWNLLSTPNDAEALADEICRSFDEVDSGKALDDVRAALDEMLSNELVVTADGS